MDAAPGGDKVRDLDGAARRLDAGVGRLAAFFGRDQDRDVVVEEPAGPDGFDGGFFGGESSQSPVTSVSALRSRSSRSLPDSQLLAPTKPKLRKTLIPTHTALRSSAKTPSTAPPLPPPTTFSAARPAQTSERQPRTDRRDIVAVSSGKSGVRRR